MSVSLREKVAEIVYDTCYKYAKIRKKLNNVKPRGILDRGFEDAHETKKDIVNKASEKLIALIGKCATPTFSGKDKPFNEKYGLEIGGKFIPFKDLPTDITELRKLIDKSTEQKEYCEHTESNTYNVLAGKKICAICHKPIPAEKKECECEIGYGKDGICQMCGKPDKTGNIGTYGFCNIKPEPKPKDRIELGDTEKIVLQTDREYGNTDSIWDILEILAERIDNHHINKES
jgi:hypothetical protein